MNSIADERALDATSAVASRDVVAAARQFTRHLSTLLAKEHAALVQFLLALAEFDGRRLWADLGYASLFDFLHRELGMSAGAAFYRKTAASLVQRFPEILDALADGRLCLTTLGEVAKVITDGNAREVLPQFFHRSRREAKAVAAAIAPETAPARRDVITAVGVEHARRVEVRPPTSTLSDESPTTVDGGSSTGGGASTANTDAGTAEPLLPAAATSTHRMEWRRVPAADHVEPLTASLRRVHMTVSERWVRKLEALRAALSHSHPAGRAEEITEYALDVALEHVSKKKGLVGRKPPSSRRVAAKDPATAARTRRQHIPADVRRIVTARDEGRCQWKLHDGAICGSNVRVQVDHVHPVAMGGPSTPANLRLLCERHNQLAARRIFGDAWMDQCTTQGTDSS